MSAIEINRWMKDLLASLGLSQQRQLVVFQGSPNWCDDRFAGVLELDPAITVLSDRNICSSAIPFAGAETCLGSQSLLVVVDLFEGFNPDVLCIGAGLVRKGGVLLLLAPMLRDWDLQQDRYATWQDGRRSEKALFVDYFFDSLLVSNEIGICLSEDMKPESRPLIPDLPILESTPMVAGETLDQTRCLDRIETWIAAGNPGVVLLDAARGRGKSTCLGLLIRRLPERYRVLVSAKSRQAAMALLQQAPAARFVSPDRLIQRFPEADIVVIDEAAMIPQSMLSQLKRLYPRLIMATTSGGYEGTGQGFMLRFVAAMEDRQLLRLTLDRPVRWCEGDCLETWLDQCLMLDNTSPARLAIDRTSTEFRVVIPGETAADGNLELLRQVYQLLNSAHYRTRPSDLRMLMENPDLLLIVALRGDIVCAAVLLNPEGGFDADLCEQVYLGTRRPRGHLLAQMLTAQAGLKQFARYYGMRVQRIAVAAPYRRQGLGSELLERALDYCREQSCDYLGASFALEPETASFWQKSGFELAHVSYAQGKSTGNHSIAVLIPLPGLSPPDRLQWRQRIQRQLPVWMTQFLQTMQADQVVALLRYAHFDTDLSLFEQQEVESFAYGNRGFELCFASLQKFVMRQLARSSQDFPEVLVEKAVQNRPWEQLLRETGAEGRKHLQQRLRLLVDGLLKGC